MQSDGSCEEWFPVSVVFLVTKKLNEWLKVLNCLTSRLCETIFGMDHSSMLLSATNSRGYRVITSSCCFKPLKTFSHVFDYTAMLNGTRGQQ